MVKRALTLRPLAVHDLDDIWTYTAETWSVTQAETYLAGLGATFDLLCEFPELARERVEISPPVRIHPYRQHVVIYVAKAETLDVMRVVHGRANWAQFLSE